MVMVTFSTNELALLRGEKTQTIRKNLALWARHYRGLLQAKEPPSFENDFKHGLRIQWRAPYAKGSYLMGYATDFTVWVIHGFEITDEIAQRDGYDRAIDLLGALARLHDMEPMEVSRRKWAVITWRWYYGPFLPGQYDFLSDLGALEAYRSYKAGDINWYYKMPDWRE